MAETVTGVVAFLASFVQWYFVWNYFDEIKKHGNAATSSFSVMAVWSGLLFGIILFGFGIALMFRMF